MQECMLDEYHETSSGIDDQPASNMKPEEVDKVLRPPEVTEFQRQKLDQDSKKNWDLFYKRNGDRFFKNRYWTKREFPELFQAKVNEKSDFMTYLLEIGCGCGDFVWPLLEHSDQKQNEDSSVPDNLFIYCCDISDQAIKLLKENPMYMRHHPKRISAFAADVSKSMDLRSLCNNYYMDMVSLIFVLSAVDPRNMRNVITNVYDVLKPGGLVLFRDYAMFDKAMLRFNQRSKICDNLYVRQDGTRAYFFTKRKLIDLFQDCNFIVESIEQVHRETINNSTGEKFSRIFLQAKFRKPLDS